MIHTSLYTFTLTCEIEILLVQGIKATKKIANLRNRYAIIYKIFFFQTHSNLNFASLKSSIDSLSSKYENIILLGDFKSCIDDSPMTGFCETYKLRNLVKHPTCFKNPENPSCIDLILTNRPLSFLTTTVIETRLSELHKMIVAVMKVHFPKMKPRAIRYRKYKTFNNDAFVDTLRQELTKQGKVLDEKGLDAFSETCTDVLDKHAPQRKQYLRSNHKPFMNNEISKAVMRRTRLQNRLLKNRSN